MAQNKERYEMVNLYIASRQLTCITETNQLCRQRLNTVFDDWKVSCNVEILDEEIKGLTGTILTKWYINFVQTRKASTVNNYLSFLCPFLSWANDMGYIPKDFSRVLKRAKITPVSHLPMQKRPQEKYLTHGEAKKLLETNIGGQFALRNRAIVALFLYSGIRVSELCSLKIGDVINHPKGYIYCKRKGGEYKYVQVAHAFYDYLSDYLMSRDDCADMDSPLFITNRGGAMDRHLIYMTIAPIQKQIGIATGSHALRHTYISEVDKIGGPTVARDLANHSSLKITNIYDHTTKEQRRNVLESLDWAK